MPSHPNTNNVILTSSSSLNAAGSAISDKADEKTHEGKAEVHKEAAKQ
jgi:hypothetical protein